MTRAALLLAALAPDRCAVVRERVWLHGKARYLEPGCQIMSEEDAAKLASLGYLE